MLKRFGTWIDTYRRGFALAFVVAGLLALVLIAFRGFRGIEITYWKSQAQACGSLYVVSGSVTSGDPQAATTCFMQAYTHCRAAMLVESAGNFDVPSTSTYLIEPQLFAGDAHSCSIQLNLAIGGSLQGLRSNNDWVECAGGVEQRSDGLHFSGCGRYGELVVPST